MASISYYEHFTAVDWEGMSRRVGRLSPAVCILCAFAASLAPSYDFLTSVWATMVGLVLSIWEMPEAYWLLPFMHELKQTFLEDYKLKLHTVRSAVYGVLGYAIIVGGSFCILAGYYVVLCGVLYIFAYINRRSDGESGVIDQHDTGEDDLEHQNDEERVLLASARFGTF